jgi:hypothetical protein
MGETFLKKFVLERAYGRWATGCGSSRLWIQDDIAGGITNALRASVEASQDHWKSSVVSQVVLGRARLPFLSLP